MKLIDELRQVGVVQLAGHLNLNQNLAFNKQICGIVPDLNILEEHLGIGFDINREISQTQLYNHRPLVYLFQKPIPKMPVDFEGRTDDLLRQGTMQ